MKLESPLLQDFNFIILYIFLLPSSSLRTQRWPICFFCFVTLFSTLTLPWTSLLLFQCKCWVNLVKRVHLLLIFSKHQMIFWIGATNLLTRGTNIYWVWWVFDYLLVFTFIYLYFDNSVKKYKKLPKWYSELLEI